MVYEKIFLENMQVWGKSHYKFKGTNKYNICKDNGY